MSDAKIPLLQFDVQKAQDIPFEIFSIEEHLNGEHIPSLFRQTFYLIVIVTGGTGTSQIDFKTYPIKHGGIYFITPGQVQKWESTQPLSGYAILFDE
ncbi:MAG: AraC family ligand binding domain-containing protein, partial [Chloroflexota bacterium]